MAFPVRFIEWRRLDDSSSWHLFIGHKSICGRIKTNGEFQYAEGKPPQDQDDEKICRLCLKNIEALKERLKQVL